MTINEIISGLGFPFFSLLLLGVISLLFSSFVKISTVFAILRAGLGANSIPSSFVTGALSIILTFFIMYPYIKDAAISIENLNQTSAGNKESLQVDALGVASKSWKEFMIRHTDPEVLKEFHLLATDIDKNFKNPKDKFLKQREAREWRVVAPAFYVTELREAFATGLSLFLPFLIIDLCVAQALVAMGITKLDPLYVALPAKLLLFVSLDGWSLITENLVASYAG